MARPGGFHDSYLIPGLVRNGFLTRFWAFRRPFTSRHLLPRKSGDSVFELPLSKPGRNFGLLRQEVIRWQLPSYHFPEALTYLGSSTPAHDVTLYHIQTSQATSSISYTASLLWVRYEECGLRLGYEGVLRNDNFRYNRPQVIIPHPLEVVKWTRAVVVCWVILNIVSHCGEIGCL